MTAIDPKLPLTVGSYRPEAGGTGTILRLCRQLGDHLPAADGEEDRGGSKHVGRSSRVRARCVEPGW